MSKIGITPGELKTLVSEAIKTASEEAAEKLRRETEEKRREAEIHRLKAERIIAGIPARARTEALAGRSHAIVMSVGYNDWQKGMGPFSGPGVGNNPSPYSLTGVAQLVWQACVDANLKPTLEYWHDGQGVQSGHNIIIHW